jgi:hypothetical protein
MRDPVQFFVYLVLGLCFLAFIMACFGACGANVQQLIVDILTDSRTQYVRIR